MITRRQFLGSTVALSAATLTGCSVTDKARSPIDPDQGIFVKNIPPLRPGTPELVRGIAKDRQQLILTVDDGVHSEAVAAHAYFAEHTQLPIVYNPNFAWRKNWEAVTHIMQPLIDRGQVQISNHTKTHADLTTLSVQQAEHEVLENERWIQETWGVTTRPYFRPPYGAINDNVTTMLGELGYTRILLWNSTFRDAAEIAVEQYRHNMYKALFPGAVVLSHVNTSVVKDQIYAVAEYLKTHNLSPITLDTAFSTNRADGA